jgi:polar amino acid transport system substrate-binding protein
MVVGIGCAAAIVVIALLAGCGQSATGVESPAAALRMIGNENVGFFEVTDGTATGFSVELAREIAGRIGRQLTVAERPFPALFPLLQAGDADMAMSAISITPERRLEVDFSQPYFESGQALLVRSDSAIAGTGDLRGKDIGVLRGSTNQREAQQVPGVGAIVAYEEKAPMFEALIAGRVDAVICDTPFALYESNQTVELTVAEILSGGDEYGIAVRKGDDELRSAIDGALNGIRADGTYQKLYEHYFGK